MSLIGARVRSFSQSLGVLLGVQHRFGEVHAVMLLDADSRVVDGIAFTDAERTADDVVESASPSARPATGWSDALCCCRPASTRSYHRGGRPRSLAALCRLVRGHRHRAGRLARVRRGPHPLLRHHDRHGHGVGGDMRKSSGWAHVRFRPGERVMDIPDRRCPMSPQLRGRVRRRSLAKVAIVGAAVGVAGGAGYAAARPGSIDAPTSLPIGSDSTSTTSTTASTVTTRSTSRGSRCRSPSIHRCSRLQRLVRITGRLAGHRLAGHELAQHELAEHELTHDELAEHQLPQHELAVHRLGSHPRRPRRRRWLRQRVERWRDERVERVRSLRWLRRLGQLGFQWLGLRIVGLFRVRIFGFGFVGWRWERRNGGGGG